MSKPKIIINYLLFQLGWFSCVSIGATSWHWAGSFVVLCIVLFHLNSALNPRQELILVSCAVVVGFVWDSALVWTGLLQYEYGTLAAFLAPHWIIAMWALFATTVNLSMRWLKSNLVLAAVFGAVGGPLSLYAGHNLGAVQIPDITLAMTTLAFGWAILLPGLVWLAGHFDGFSEATRIKAN